METRKLNYTLLFPPFGGNVGVRDTGGRQRGFRAFIIALLFYAAFPRISVWKSLLVWIIVASIFEVLQPVLTNGNREFEWMDIIMNIAGFSVIAVFYIIKFRWRQSRFSS